MTSAPKLSDLQLILLSTASRRETGSLIPLPDSMGIDMPRVEKAIIALIRKALIEEAPVLDRNLAWRQDDQDPVGLFITAAGREAIGAGAEGEETNGNTGDVSKDAVAGPDDPLPETPVFTPRAGSKGELVLALLCREGGATLAELMELTGWLPHTTRATLTGLRKKGYDILRSKRGETSCYTIAAAAGVMA